MPPLLLRRLETVTEEETKEETTEETTEAAEEDNTEAEASDGNSVYLEQVDTMNKAAEEFITISMEFMQLSQDDPENIEGMSELIEKTRNTKKAFVDFAALDTVPEGLEEAHGKLASAATGYADTLDIYCDVLLATVKGEEHEAMATIQEDWTNAATALSDAMGEVEEVIAAQ